MALRAMGLWKRRLQKAFEAIGRGAENSDEPVGFYQRPK
jgi:hypothetical protein